MRLKIFIICLIAVFVSMTTQANDVRGKQGLRKSSIVGDVVTMDINRIELPLQNDGSLGEDGQGFYPKGSGIPFLFQGGIAATAFVDGQLRASWMAKASLIQEYQPGKWGMDPDDSQARFFIVDKSDGFGSQAYIDWAEAVELGADFQDLDGDGQYNPDVDRPDMIGDRIIWCVYNDGTPITVRTPRLGTDPIGLEVHQHMWAFARSDELGDVVFIRYRFINTAGTDINDLVFSIWEDPDLGDFQDDLIGSDTTRSLGFIYNDGDDTQYGPNPPAFGIDFFQGPVIFTGVNTDTAFKSRGPFFGVDTLVGWKNLPMTSFMYYINGDPVLDDPSNAGIARNYQVGGLDRNGDPIDPTAWGTGGTADTDNRFFYSGTPEDGTGWLDITPADKRFMVNTGPFQLANGDTQDVVVAYIVTQGNDPLNSVSKLRVVDDVAQGAYNANFQIAGGPPAPRVDVRTFDERIELIIDLEANGTLHHDESDPLGSRQVFEGIKIYQFGSNTTSENVGGRINKKLLTTFDLDNQFNGDIFAQNTETGEIIKIYDASLRRSIDPNAFVDEGAGILRYVIETDAFDNNQPLVNGFTYYFAVTAFSLNEGIIPATGEPILYQDPDFGVNNWVSRKPAGITLLENDITLIAAQPESDELQPFRAEAAEYVGNRANVEGRVFVDLARRELYTGHDYEISFFDNGNFWQLQDLTTNTIPFFVTSLGDTVFLDSMQFQASALSDEDTWTFPIVDGLSVQVYNVPDQLDTANIVLTDTSQVAWIKGSSQFANSSTSIFGKGIDFASNIRANIADGFRKEDYFPVKLVIDTTDIAMAHQYIANWRLFRGMKPVKLQAFDMSDPESPQQLNVAFLNPAGFIDFTANTEIIILKSDYNEDGVYGASGGAEQDSAFKSDAYLICNFDPIADSLLLANPLEITVKPYYPNSDVDKFRIKGQDLNPQLSENEAKGLLEEVRVVPNPYFVTSKYETSFDTPILRFTHLPSQRVTIRIFNLAGQQVNVLQKDDNRNEMTWNLENSSGLKVASGFYIAHVSAEGVGEKVLKFMVIQREERIDRF